MSKRERLKVITPADRNIPIVWEVAKEIIRAEEEAYVKARLKPVEKIMLPREEYEKTEVLDKTSFPIRGDYRLIDVVGRRGKLRELMIMSPSSSFSVLMITDGKKKIERSYSDLTTIGEELDFLAAFEKNGSYILKVANIPWIDEFLFLIHTDTAVTFTWLYGLWTEYVK